MTDVEARFAIPHAMRQGVKNTEKGGGMYAKSITGSIACLENIGVLKF